MTPAGERVYVGGVVTGAYPIPDEGQVVIEDPDLRHVLDAVGLVSGWSGQWPVDVTAVYDTLRVVHGIEQPAPLLDTLMHEWDAADARARELVPLLLVVRWFDAAVAAQAAAAEAMRQGLERHERARADVDQLVALFEDAA